MKIVRNVGYADEESCNSCFYQLKEVRGTCNDCRTFVTLKYKLCKLPHMRIQQSNDVVRVIATISYR